MGELAVHAIDVVLADAPAGPGTPVRTFSHPLGECGTSFFAASALARKSRKGFPGSLDGVPVLLPSSDSTFRRALDEWFQSHKIRPEIIAELDDLALASVLGETGLGVLAAHEPLGFDRATHRTRDALAYVLHDEEHIGIGVLDLHDLRFQAHRDLAAFDPLTVTVRDVDDHAVDPFGESNQRGIEVALQPNALSFGQAQPA